MKANNVHQPPAPGKRAQAPHFLERAVHADMRAAAAGDPEARRAWSDMAALYRQLAALAGRESWTARG